MRRRRGAAEQQFVILAAAKRERRIVADRLAVGRGERQRAGVDLGARAAALEKMAEVLPESVAQIDRGGRRLDARQAQSGLQARCRLQEAIDKKLARGGARAVPKPPRENAQSGGRVAQRAGDVEGVAGPRGIAPQCRPRTSPSRAIVMASALARVTLPPTTSTPARAAALPSPWYIRSKNRKPSPSRTARLTTHTVGFPPIAAMSLRLTVSARAPSASGVPHPSRKCTSSTIESIVRSWRRVRGRQDGTIVAGTQESAVAPTEALQQALDQVEFSGRFAHMIRQAAKGVTRILRSGCHTPR